MLLLAPLLILLLTAAAISLIALLRPRFAYSWLIAVGGALLAWIFMWVLRFRLPVEAGALQGGFLDLTLPSMSFQADGISWSLAMAVVTLAVAVFFTDAGQAAETSWIIWAGDLGLAAVGVAAILAGNLSTMLLGWALVDIIELGILLRQLRQEEMRRRAFVFFGMNLLGSMMVVAAIIAAGPTGVSLNLAQIPPEAQIYLILAVGLRLGVFPLQVAFLRDVRHQRGQGTLLKLIPPLVSLSLLVHASNVQVPPPWKTIMLIFAALAAVYGAIVWLRAGDELRGRLYWIISVAGFAFAAAVQAQTAAALSWGLALAYPGALLFLSPVRTRWMAPLGVIGVFTLSALPFSPTFTGLALYRPFHMLTVLFPLAHILLLAGMVRYMLRETEPLIGVEPWVRVIYITGLALLPLTHLATAFLEPTLRISGSVPFWPWLVSLALVALGAFAWQRKIELPALLFERLDSVFSLRWVYQVLGWIYRALGWAAERVTALLEGDGGILWALLFLLILAAILGEITPVEAGA